MDTILRLIQQKLLKKSVTCLGFIVFLALSAQAQLGIPPVVTTPIALSGVLSLGNAATNGGSFSLTATATSLTSNMKGIAWYCGNQPVPAGKCTISTTGIGSLTAISTLTMTGVAFTNAGQYSLHATNSSGTTVSTSLILTVQNVVNTVISNVVNTASFVAGTVGLTSSGFQFKLSGPTGSNVVIQASSDMIHWTSISTNTFASGLVDFTDTAAKTNVFRYYRTYSP